MWLNNNRISSIRPQKEATTLSPHSHILRRPCLSVSIMMRVVPAAKAVAFATSRPASNRYVAFTALRMMSAAPAIKVRKIASRIGRRLPQIAFLKFVLHCLLYCMTCKSEISLSTPSFRQAHARNVQVTTSRT